MLVRGVSRVAQSLHQNGARAMASHQCRHCQAELPSKNQLFTHLREAHGYPEPDGAKPKRERCTAPEVPVVDAEVLGDPIRFPENGPWSQFPKILHFFNRLAQQEPPVFRVPSAHLAKEVPWEELKLAWEKGLLCAISCGVKDTFKKEDQEHWLEMLSNTQEQDILLSPLQPELHPDLLVAILRSVKSATPHDLFRFARGTWNHQDGAEKWKACAQQALDRVHMKFIKPQCPLVSLRGHATTQLDVVSHEDFVFRFLRRVNGEIFQCLGSIAESMYYYNPECHVDKSTCYKLIQSAIEAGNILNMSLSNASKPYGEASRSGRDSRMAVELREPGDCIRVMDDEHSGGASKGAEWDRIHKGRRVQLVPLEDLEPTQASVQAAACERRYGGSFARRICENWKTGVCRWGGDCKYIHLKVPKKKPLLSDGLQDACAISNATLKDVFWRNMEQGRLRTPLKELVERLREECEGWNDAQVLAILQEEALKENLVLLVAASSAEKAHYWGNQVLQDLASSLDDREVCVLVSPVLLKPPASLLECLTAHCKQELLWPSFLHLKKVCLSCFALRISSDGFLKLIKYVGYFLVKNGSKQRSSWAVGCRGEKFRARWAPTDNQSNVTQRRNDLRKFLGTSASRWPSTGVLLESARRFGPDSLRPTSERRSRLAALFCLLQEIEGKALELDDSSSDADDADFGSTSSDHVQSDPWPAPHDVEHHVWPLHIDDYSVEDSLAWLCAHGRGELGPLQGKRVIRLTPGQYRLSMFVNKLVYGLEPDATGSLDPARVESLLHAVKPIGALPSSIPKGASYDLILATLVSYFRRHLLNAPSSAIPIGQEVLANLLIAKALGRGQGRRHSLRNSIMGWLWRHPKFQGRISTVCRGGSVAMALDTVSSDHDIILCLKDGGTNMVDELYDVILDLKKHCHRERLQRAKVAKKDFAVEISNFYRQVDFDLVPVTYRDGGKEYQWDPQRQVWQALLHPRLAPHIQGLSEEHPDAFFAMRLVKIWNESMHFRQGKAPLVTLHIPLLTLGAWKSRCLDDCHFVQDYLLRIFQYIQENWLRKDLSEQVPLLMELEAAAHLQRMIAKYDEATVEHFSTALEQGIQLLHRGGSAQELVDIAGQLFRCQPLLRRNACSR